MLRSAHFQLGVSLIELMIGLALVGILLGMGAPNLRTFMQNSEIRSAADAIQNGISLAKMEAVRRNTGVQFVLGAGSSWTVSCVTAVDDDDGDGAPDCPGALPTATNPAIIQSRSLEEGSGKAEVTTTNTSLSFDGIGRAASLAAGTNAVFNITNPTGGTCVSASGKMRCLRVIVTSAGQVRMCDPARPSNANPPDPQAC